MAGGLRALLAREGAQVSAAFARRWEAFSTSLHSWKAWEIAYVMHNGCSDDWFDVFRSWVIILGQHAVEEVAEDPLAWALAQPRTLSMNDGADDAERMSYAAV